MSGKHLYVVAFDVSCDRARRKAGAILETVGVRVQESVFEAVLTEKRAAALEKELLPLIDPKTDGLRFYCVPRSFVRKCRAAYGGVVSGDGTPLVF
jgi:CRISPR-associated protein Cas2